MSRKAKYSKEFKLEAVQDILNKNLSIVKVCDRLSINESDLRKWISYYKSYGVNGLTPKPTNTKYISSFKLEVVKSIEDKGLSFREASIRYNIPSNSTVRKWYLIYQEKGIKGLAIESRGRRKTMKKKRVKKPHTREAELLLENQALKAELALLKKLHALAQAREKKQ